MLRRWFLPGWQARFLLAMAYLPAFFHMPWHARLDLDYHRGPQGPTVLHHRHHGPLRIFKSLYPEGPAVCHNVIVHPPGGLVQGDRLEVEVRLQPGAHALVSTPGATRFYKSTTGERAVQSVRLQLGAGARLEWLPLETLAYPGCAGLNTLALDLQPEAELMAWDVLGLGLPAAQQPFTHGVLEQTMAWPGVWLERARIAAEDQRLLHSPLGLAGHATCATLVFAAGTPLSRHRREALFASGRAVLEAQAGDLPCGITAPNAHMLVARALSPTVEPVMALWQAVWAVWRQEAWGLAGTVPRIWKV